MLSSSSPDVPAFLALPEDVAGGPDSDGCLDVYGRMPDSPASVVTLPIHDPAGPGGCALDDGETSAIEAEWPTTWTSYRTSGAIDARS